MSFTHCARCPWALELPVRFLWCSRRCVKAKLTLPEMVFGAGRGFATLRLSLLYRIWYTRDAMSDKGLKRIPAIFFRTAAGREPVREWLRELKPVEDRKQIGVDIQTVEFGWPIGMPVCRPLGDGLYEVRSDLSRNRIARVLFYIDRESRMVLLHGFIKKTQKTPAGDLELARRNKGLHEAEMKKRG